LHSPDFKATNNENSNMTKTVLEVETVPSVLRDVAEDWPDRIAVRSGGQGTTFSEFDRQSDRVAAGLAARGISKGDRVALYCPNSDVFALAYVGIVKAGGTVVPINFLLNPKEIEFILADAEAKVMIYHGLFVDAVRACRTVVSHRCVHIGNAKSDPGDVSWEEIVTSDNPVPEVDFDPAADLVAILYTSGTTGRPKGAMLTHRNLLTDARGVVTAIKIVPGKDVLLVVLPMFHAFAATVGMLTPLLHGCSFIPVPRFDPNLVADTISEGKATIFLGVPSMYAVLMNLPDGQVKKFASLRYCISGGAVMPRELMRRFEARFQTLIYEGDGPTECSPVTCVNPVDGKRKPGSVGLPIPGVQMCILNNNGVEVPDNDLGEICVRGNSVMKGYWKQPKETAAAFHGDWFRTGDLGCKDDDGYFYIVDRIKDMIIVNGMNVYPRVVEEVLYQCDAVQEAAVVGEPHRLHGEVPVAYVVLKQGRKADSGTIRAFCREHLGPHEVPRKVIFLDVLPKNAAGKILKRELRKHGELERGVDANGDEQG
jgi:long-chain acyl-CoA synthetase